MIGQEITFYVQKIYDFLHIKSESFELKHHTDKRHQHFGRTQASVAAEHRVLPV